MIIRQSSKIIRLNFTQVQYGFTRESFRRWFAKKSLEPKDELLQATDFKTFLNKLGKMENVPQTLTFGDKFWIMGTLFKKYFKYFMYFFFKMLYGIIDEYKRFLILGAILWMI